MSKASIACVTQESTECTSVTANEAAIRLIAAIVKQLKKEGGFTLPSFATFTVTRTKARKAINPTGVIPDCKSRHDGHAAAFLLYGLTAVGLLAFTMPPFQNSDEGSHSLRAAQLAVRLRHSSN